MLRQTRAERTAMSATPVPASEAYSGGTSFATSRGNVTPATTAHIGAPPGLARPVQQTPQVPFLFLDQNQDPQPPNQRSRR
eukprot:3971126-Heterocapsa_arctica.AAC.2